MGLIFIGLVLIGLRVAGQECVGLEVRVKNTTFKLIQWLKYMQCIDFSTSIAIC